MKNFSVIFIEIKGKIINKLLNKLFPEISEKSENINLYQKIKYNIESTF